MSTPELCDKNQEFLFLGTLAGNQAFLPASGNKITYGRVYTPFGGTTSLREKMNNFFLNMSETTALGNSTAFEHGVYFHARNCLIGKVQQLSSSQYALSRVGAQIEKLTKSPLEETLNQCSAYGINYILHYYFDCVNQPAEGDLVVYSKADSNCCPVGIYKNTKPNWNSPRGGTVESKWANGCLSPFLINHDFFFVPALYGDEAKFYRVKEALDIPITPQQQIDPMCVLQAGGNFSFTQTKDNRASRLEIDQTRGSELLKKFPQIEKEAHISISNGYFKCFYYALGKVLRVYDQLNLPSADKISKDRLLFLDKSILNEYFVTTEFPQPGDLVIYSD